MNSLDNYLEKSMKQRTKLNLNEICKCIIGKDFKKYDPKSYITPEDIMLAEQMKLYKEELEKAEQTKRYKNNNVF
ncbi:MAG: hypothetical protein WC376_04245 [Candidatus Nanoarchaeia archaeon]|jgi:hypothetical protein